MSENEEKNFDEEQNFDEEIEQADDGDAGANEFGEFDDWYNDGENCGQELQNQAASLEEAGKDGGDGETRKQLSAEDYEGNQFYWGGDLYVRFANPNATDGQPKTKFLQKHGSGHIIKDCAGGGWILGTCRTNLFHTLENEGILEPIDGVFILQRTDKGTNKGVFKFTAADIVHYDIRSIADMEDEGDVFEKSGPKNLSAIRLRDGDKNCKINGDLPSTEDWP